MSDSSMKLELVLLGKDLLGRILGKDIGFLKNFKKEGEAAAKAADKLDAAKKKMSRASGVKNDTSGIKKTTAEINKQAQAQEKLNNAIKRQPKRGADGRLRDERGKYVSDGRTSPPNGQKNRSRNQGGFEEDLIQGGTGAGMLWASKTGMSAAMTKQEALTDLYTSFYRANMSAADLNSQMLQGEKIGERLGNLLPGTTADFIQLFSTMKQRGIEAKVILDGAGESAAYLAVANKEDLQDVGVNVARFGQMFNLRTRDEYLRATDLMSRANTTYQINSSELMEAVKDFSGRTGKGLGLEGTKGAEDTLRYLAFLRAKTGLQGLTVGNSASSFFNQYLQAKEKKKDPTEELKKLTGVDLKIFDTKGKFLGLENAVKEFAKLKGKLTDEQQVNFGNKLAGEEGASIFQAMVKDGAQWGQFNEEMTNSMSLMDKSAKNAENLTNKLEALTGSLSNLGATGFGPLVGPISKASDGLNSFVGYLNEVGKGRPILAATTSSVITLGGAFLALKGGSGVASRFFSGSSGSIIALGNDAAQTTKKVGGLKSSLTSVSGVFKILLLMETIGFTFEQVQKFQEQVEALKKTQSGINDAGQMSYKAYQQIPEKEKDPQREAKSMLDLLQEGKNRQLEFAFDRSRMPWYDRLIKMGSNPFINDASPKTGDTRYTELRTALEKLTETQQRTLGLDKLNPLQMNSYVQREIASVDLLRKRAPSLNDPNVMTAFRKDAPQALNLAPDMKASLERMLSQAFPQSFAQSNQQMAEQANQLNQAFANLVQPSTGLGEQFNNLNNNSNTASTSVGNFANAANSAASRLNNVTFTPPTFTSIKIPMYSQTPVPLFGNPLGRAKGGSVNKGHTYRINEIGQEFFTPNQSGSVVANDVLRKNRQETSSGVYINFSPTVNVDSGNTNAEQIVKDVQREFAIFKSQLQEELSSRNLTKKVAYESDRDSDRS